LKRQPGCLDKGNSAFLFGQDLQDLIDVDLANSYHGGMPRHRRLNIPGAINHVITRGLNRKDIFLDNCDRNDFLGRLEKNLSLTGCRCC